MSDIRFVTIVQARHGSSRLPGKALRALHGQPLLLHVLERARAIGHWTWLATTDRDADGGLYDLALAHDFPVYRGDERDVMRRMLEVALTANADAVVRVTGDCPMLAPDVAQQVIQLFLDNGRRGIATNDTNTSGWPDGTDVEVFSVGALAAADLAAPRPTASDDKTWRYREHVTPLIRNAGPHHVLPCPDKGYKKFKLSVDTMEDFDRVAAVMAQLDGGGLDWTDTRAAVNRWNAKGAVA